MMFTYEIRQSTYVKGHRGDFGHANSQSMGTEYLPVENGATFHQYVATVGANKLEIDVAPWSEEHLRVNGQEIAQAKDKDRRQAFRDLKQIAERYLRGQALEPQQDNKPA